MYDFMYVPPWARTDPSRNIDTSATNSTKLDLGFMLYELRKLVTVHTNSNYSNYYFFLK